MESILTSVKKLLGIAEEDKHFDDDIIMHINSVFMVLTQIGVGPSEGFTISDRLAIWEDFLPEKSTSLGLSHKTIATYMALKVRLLFDPPASSAVTETINRMIAEFEWRFGVAVDSGDAP